MGHNDWVNSITFAEKYLFSASRDCTIKVKKKKKIVFLKKINLHNFFVFVIGLGFGDWNLCKHIERK